MKDPEKDPYVIISSFNWREVFKPSFIGRLQSRLAVIFKDRDKNKYNNMKFKLIMVPADEQPVEKTPARALAEYWEAALSQEKLADMAERMKEMFKEWWAVSARQYLADNELEELSNESSSSETDESRENTSVG